MLTINLLRPHTHTQSIFVRFASVLTIACIVCFLCFHFACIRDIFVFILIFVVIVVVFASGFLCDFFALFHLILPGFKQWKPPETLTLFFLFMLSKPHPEFSLVSVCFILSIKLNVCFLCGLNSFVITSCVCQPACTASTIALRTVCLTILESTTFNSLSGASATIFVQVESITKWILQGCQIRFQRVFLSSFRFVYPV